MKFLYISYLAQGGKFEGDCLEASIYLQLGIKLAVEYLDLEVYAFQSVLFLCSDFFKLHPLLLQSLLENSSPCTKIIASHHFLSSSANNMDIIQKTLVLCESIKPFISKVVISACSFTDSLLFAPFYKPGRILLAMGKEGWMSRMLNQV